MNSQILVSILFLISVFVSPYSYVGLEAGISNFFDNFNNIDVCSKEQLLKVVKDARPGDQIHLCEGVWKDVNLLVKKSGTKANPIVITTRTPGSVTISGDSYIKLAGSYINISGFRWVDYGNPKPMRGYIQTSSESFFCKISEMVFEEDRQTLLNDWIFNIALRGKEHEVFNSAFLGKRSKGAQVFVWEGGKNLNHNLHHLYFRRKPLGFDNGEPINGGESLQLGAGDGVELPADDIRAHHLYFDNASGEPEIISVKGSRQILNDIVMIGCEGQFSLRLGNNNHLSRVFIDGLNKPNALGLRILGGNHIIQDTFVTGISDRWKGGIFFQSGVQYHDAADNVLIENVTLMNCADAITIGTKGVAPSNLIFKRIIAVQKSPKDRVLFVSGGADKSFEFSNSFLFGKMNVPKPVGVQVSNPFMVAERDGLYIPDLKGPATGYGARLRMLPVYKHQTGPQTYYLDY